MHNQRNKFETIETIFKNMIKLVLSLIPQWCRGSTLLIAMDLTQFSLTENQNLVL